MTTPDESAGLTKGLGRLMFAARWMMAPIYLGLLIGLLLLMVKFAQRLLAIFPALLEMSSSDTVLSVLALVDLSLVANLILVVVLAGWQGFVDPLMGKGLDNQPSWLALDFSALKLKLIGGIATIAALEMLEGFMHVASTPPGTIAWQLAILLSIGILGVMLAAMDRISRGAARN